MSLEDADCPGVQLLRGAPTTMASKISHGSVLFLSAHVLCADGELTTSVEDAERPEVVRSEESAAVGLRNLVTQWHLTQKGAPWPTVQASLCASPAMRAASVMQSQPLADMRADCPCWSLPRRSLAEQLGQRFTVVTTLCADLAWQHMRG